MMNTLWDRQTNRQTDGQFDRLTGITYINIQIYREEQTDRRTDTSKTDTTRQLRVGLFCNHPHTVTQLHTHTHAHTIAKNKKNQLGNKLKADKCLTSGNGKKHSKHTQKIRQQQQHGETKDPLREKRADPSEETEKEQEVFACQRARTCPVFQEPSRGS